MFTLWIQIMNHFLKLSVQRHDVQSTKKKSTKKQTALTPHQSLGTDSASSQQFLIKLISALIILTSFCNLVNIFIILSSVFDDIPDFACTFLATADILLSIPFIPFCRDSTLCVMASTRLVNICISPNEDAFGSLLVFADDFLTSILLVFDSLISFASEDDESDSDSESLSDEYFLFRLFILLRCFLFSSSSACASAFS